MKLFVSVGNTYTPEQEEFIAKFEAFLSQNGCERLTVGRGMHFAKHPIAAARDQMKQANGIVVIAFTRFMVESAIEKPGSQDAVTITQRRTPTIWNHIEAAMAFGLDLPMLMIIEDGLYQEAMIKDRYEYRALVTKMDKSFLMSEEFIATFKDWQNHVRESALGRADVSDADFTLGQIFKGLRVSQIWQIGASSLSILSAVAAAAYWIGSKFPPQ